MDAKAYRNELIQVAAVAVAMVVDLDSGSTSDPYANGVAYLDVRKERKRQEEKWGPQHHDPLDWLMILMEEVGEVAEEIDSRHHLRQVVANNGRGARRYLKARFGQ